MVEIFSQTTYFWGGIFTNRRIMQRYLFQETKSGPGPVEKKVRLVYIGFIYFRWYLFFCWRAFNIFNRIQSNNLAIDFVLVVLDCIYNSGLDLPGQIFYNSLLIFFIYNRQKILEKNPLQE